MHRNISNREFGFKDPLSFYREEITRRVRSIELSRHKDVERLFTGSINTLDIDIVEKRYMLAGGADGFIVIYDVMNPLGKPKYTCQSVGTIGLNNRHRHKYSVETVLWYPLDTGMFTSSGTDRLLKVWDTNILKPADEYEFSGIVYNHHMSPVATKHCLIAVASNSSSVKLVDLKSGSSTHTLRGHNKSVLAVKWSPRHEFLLASSSFDKKIFLWDIRNAKSSLFVFDQKNGKRQRSNKDDSITSHDGLANGLQFLSNGLQLASCGSDHKIHLWNTMSGKKSKVNFGRVENSSGRTVQFSVSRDSKQDLLYMPSGLHIDVLNTDSGKRLQTLSGHFSQVNCCYFHPDTQELFSAGADRTILVWVPRKVNTDYEDFLWEKERPKKENKEKECKVEAPKVAATADSWSSDEET